MDVNNTKNIRKIHLLDEKTIDKIAAGEVIERPVSVIKELVENSIDAGAGAVTVEIRGGGIDFIRVTDNGCGIPRDQVRDAFLPHATSKIESAEDLFNIRSLGFRGEALSTIAAVSQVEMITKSGNDITGIRYCISGGKEISYEEVGTPDGTTFISRNLFFHTPARRKFLKSAMTEAGYVTEFVQHMAISQPHIKFKYVINGQTKLVTSGNGNIKENIYKVYGRDISDSLLPVEASDLGSSLEGFIARPVVARSSREFELFFVNGRAVDDRILSKALEEAYRPFLMQHRFPFAVLILNVDPGLVDVNVHPRKTEIRFVESAMLFEFIRSSVLSVLNGTELINSMTEDDKKETPYKAPVKAPEPFEIHRIMDKKSDPSVIVSVTEHEQLREPSAAFNPEAPVQLDMFKEKIIVPENRPLFKIIGQVFDTYWVVEYKDRMLVIDQHAAHEKVMYERLMKDFSDNLITSQYVDPPLIVTLTGKEEDVLNRFMDSFTSLGFEISPFEGNDYAVRAVPAGLMQLNEKELFRDLLDELADGIGTADVSAIHDRIAQMSCKAAVKGNTALSFREAEELLSELLSLDNPYNCPHGRPTMIEMTEKELEKKFKRIV